MSVYLALGDSMSIDDYTGVPDGGAIRQFFHTLGDEWTLDDPTYDGCQMSGVPLDGRGELVTLTIGGNDLLLNVQRFLSEGLKDFAGEHAALLRCLRSANPAAVLLVGDIYAPCLPLDLVEGARLDEANAIIRDNCTTVGAILIPIHAAFRGRESRYLCLGIEPTRAGAAAIAGLFERAWLAASQGNRMRDQP